MYAVSEKVKLFH